MNKLFFFVIISLFFSVVPVNASSFVLMDMDSNVVLKSNSKDAKGLIASISKIMTCIIAIEKGNLNDKVKVDKDILKATGSAIYVEVGETLKLEDLLYGLMLRSGNDAAIAIAKYLSGSMEEFVEIMNDYVKMLNLKNTVFYNSHGLEDNKGIGNVSTAYDMAIITSYAMKNKTFRKIFETKKYATKSDKKTYSWINKNKLLKYDYITGGKTGYTKRAGRTLVTTASINDLNLVVVTLNDGSDWNHHLELYDYAKNEYKKEKVLDKNNFKIINQGIFFENDFYIKNNYNLLIKNDDIVNTQYYINSLDNYYNGQKVGYVSVLLNNKEVHKESIFIKLKDKESFWEQLLKKIFK